MSWGGLGSYRSGASTYTNRGGPIYSSYSRGGGYSSGGAGLSSAYRTGNSGYYNHSNAHSASNLGNGTARIAVIGVTQAAFTNWWAMHVVGFEVSVVVGVEDMKKNRSNGGGSAGQTTVPAVISEDELKLSAETARAFAVRCTQFYQLPRKTTTSSTTTTATGISNTAPSTVKKESVATAAATPSTTAAVVDTAPSDRERGDVVEVRVRVADAVESEPTSTSTTTPTTTTQATTSANVTTSPGTTEAKKEMLNNPSITATAWSYFLKPYFDLQKPDTDEKRDHSSTQGTNTTRNSDSHWTVRYGIADSKSSNTSSNTAANAETTPLIDNVEVIYVASLGNTRDAETHDESSVRDALIWLISKGKHLVVDCALSSETLAACAAAAATVTRGRGEMHRIFLYRGGGVRHGWSTTAMTKLRETLAVHRGTGQASKNTTTAKAEKLAVDRTAGTAATTAAAKSKTPEAADAFSIFDFMGNALKESEIPDSQKTTSTSTTREVESSKAESVEQQVEEKPKVKPTTPIVTSLAVDADGSVVGALQQLRFTVRGCGIGRDGTHGMPCNPSLGIMDTLGWDAVAWVLHLLDWTCPDMVQGRVVRRAAVTQAPLCVEAELYYGVDGTADDIDEREDTEKEIGIKQEEESSRVARPQYLRVLLHIGANCGVRADTGDVETGPSVFQQSVRVVGTKAVVTLEHPLLPPCSQTSTTLSDTTTEGGKSSPPSATTSSPSFSVTSTRTMTGVGAASTPSDATPFPFPFAIPSIVYRYTVATQDAPQGSRQRVRKEQNIVIPGTNGEPCAEARLWQHVRTQLNVTTTAAFSTAGAAASSSTYAGLGGGYTTYGSRYANRGRYGTSLGMRGGGGYYGRGYGGGYYASSNSIVGVAQTIVKAELTEPEAAALDVQRSWLVQTVVERILASAGSVEATA